MRRVKPFPKCLFFSQFLSDQPEQEANYLTYVSLPEPAFRSFPLFLRRPVTASLDHPPAPHHLSRAEPPGARHQRQQEHRQEHQLDMITSLLTIIANRLGVIIANVPLIIIHYSTADQRKHQVLDTNISSNWT